MSRRGQSPDEPELFDLPLEPQSGSEAPKRPSRAPEERPSKLGGEGDPGDTLPLFDEAPPEELDGELDDEQLEPQPAHLAARGAPPGAGTRARLRAALADLGAACAVLATAVIGSRLMGVSLGLEQWMPLAVLLLAFSFLYFVVPLVFWGRTPGMTLAGLVSRSREGLPLTYGQAVLRWVAALITALLLGLPLLLLLRGPSLADRLSGSVTLEPTSRSN
jgi:uncharacterized RDD family membrane protein YckC